MWRNRIVERTSVKASELLDHEGNWRIHPEAQKAGMVGVLNEVGIIDALTVYRSADGLTVIDGHLRKSVDPDQEWPVDILDVDDAEADYILATKDPLAAEAAADREKLGALLHNVQSGEAGVQALLAGLAEREGVVFGNGNQPPDDPGPQIDRAAELQEKWQVQPGDLWVIPSLSVAGGEHRVVCGDCTDAAVVKRVMGGEKANLCVTSPPYFNQREYSQWKTYDDYLDFAREVVKTTTDVMMDDSIFVVNIGSDEQARRWMPSDWWVLLRDMGWLYRECIAWVKAAAVWSVPRSMHIENQHYFPAQRWEVMLVVSRGKHPKFESSDRDAIREFDENVWTLSVVTGSEQKKIGHDAPYPLDIPERFTMVYTTKRKRVYDPFLGSGTTLVACERLGRLGRGVEIEPKYVAVTLERLAGLGLEPRRVE